MFWVVVALTIYFLHSTRCRVGINVEKLVLSRLPSEPSPAPESLTR